MDFFRAARVVTSKQLLTVLPVRSLSHHRVAEVRPRGQTNRGVVKRAGNPEGEGDPPLEAAGLEELVEERGPQRPGELKEAELRSFFLPVDPEKATKARMIFTQAPKFLGSFTNIEDISRVIKGGLPEVAFTGRSNCGKSSLINSLTSQKKLVRTSKTPGHTSALNFFQIGEDFILVDMPGYGYRCRQTWLDLILTYAKTRKTLKRVCLLTDSGPGLKDIDKEKMKKFDSQGTPYQVVITKLDRRGKEAQDVIAATTKYVDKHTGSCFPEVIPVSSAKGTNIPALRISILEKLGIPL